MSTQRGKRIVICFDGTWNGRLGAEPTNINRIANCLVPRDAFGVQQVVCYLPGVGSDYAVDRLFGGAFGLGIGQSILTGYRFLTANYEPGDSVLIFGFSRGAFAARSLASMLHSPGLLDTSTYSWFLDDVVQIYEVASGERAKGKDPMRARLETTVDRSMRRLHPIKGLFKRDRKKTVADQIKEHQHRLMPIPVSFLGVFDTVGALGHRGLHRAARSHNLDLSPAVQFARQALALDEHRVAYEPLLWTRARTATTGRSAEERTPDGLDDAEPGKAERVKQVWFAGAHSDIGGGARKIIGNGLGGTALLWMLLEANKITGLAIDSYKLKENLLFSIDDIHRSSRLWSLIDGPQVMSQAFRRSPSFRGRTRRLRIDEAWNVRIASSALQRYQEGDGKYRPQNLRRLVCEKPGDLERYVEDVQAIPDGFQPWPQDLVSFIDRSFVGSRDSHRRDSRHPSR